jgi:electron transfer flavoprotein alpha subunit
VFGAVGGSLAAGLAAAGVTDVYAVTADGLDGYAPQAWARALAALADQASATAVLAAATDHGSEVLAHLGAIAGLPVAAHCVSAARSGPGRYRLVRNRWAGSLLEDAELESAPALLTVATDAPPPSPAPPPATADSMIAVSSGGEQRQKSPRSPNTTAERAAEGTVGEGGVADVADGTAGGVRVRPVRAVLADGDLTVAAREVPDQGGQVSLASARVVVGGGRGVGGADGFAPLEELAALLGGALGVSRVVTSQGWRPHRQQVGQTGTRISPQLYLACGISGAIQHMAGCASAKHIVAVNTDPDAPIIARADYAVIGDLSEVIPALLDALRQRAARS